MQGGEEEPVVLLGLVCMESGKQRFWPGHHWLIYGWTHSSWPLCSGSALGVTFWLQNVTILTINCTVCGYMSSGICGLTLHTSTVLKSPLKSQHIYYIADFSRMWHFPLYWKQESFCTGHKRAKRLSSFQRETLWQRGLWRKANTIEYVHTHQHPHAHDTNTHTHIQRVGGGQLWYQWQRHKEDSDIMVIWVTHTHTHEIKYTV